MIRIDRLNLQLPAGYEGRAHAIVQRIAAELAHYPTRQNISHEHIILPAIHIELASSDKQIAASVAGQIHHHVLGATRKNHE